jgi:hypothetical protein
MQKIDYAAVGLARRNVANIATKRNVNRTALNLLGVAATVCGTTAAILSIPNDPLPAGALFWPALWLSIGFLTAPLLGLRNDTMSILRAENVLMVGLIYWLLLDLLQGLYPLTAVSYDDVVFAFIAIGTLAGGIWVGMSGGGWRPPQVVVRAAAQQFSTRQLFSAVWVAFVLGIFWFAYSSNFDPWLMITALGWCRFCAPWSTGVLGGAESFLVNLRYFGYILPTLTVLLAHQVGWLRAKTIVCAILSLVFVAFLAQEGGRRVIGVTGGAALIAWMLLQRRIKLKFLIGGLFGVAVVLVAMEKMLEYRGSGFNAAGSNLTREEGIHVDDNFVRLAQLIDLIPRVQPYADLEPLTYFATLPIPRFFWPGKPTGPGYDLTRLLGEKDVTLTTSIIGELYAMHGVVVIFMGGFVIGRLAKMWNKIADLPGAGRTLVYSLGVMVLFAGLRSMADLVIMSYGLLAWLVIAKWTRRKRSAASFGTRPGLGHRTTTSQ